MKRKEVSQILYGLVLVGGKSERMKKDKSLLNYHGQPQSRYCFDLLSKFCDRVYLANRKTQAQLPGQKGLPQIHDLKKYAEIGPLAGILSAMSRYPKVAWLVLGCDLPFVRKKTLQTLIQKRDPRRIATAYRSAYGDQRPEPLCAIYEPKGKRRLESFLKKDIVCPRKILMNSDTKLLRPLDKKSLDNINDPHEYRQALSILKRHERNR